MMRQAYLWEFPVAAQPSVPAGRWIQHLGDEFRGLRNRCTRRKLRSTLKSQVFNSLNCAGFADSYMERIVGGSRPMVFLRSLPVSIDVCAIETCRCMYTVYVSIYVCTHKSIRRTHIHIFVHVHILAYCVTLSVTVLHYANHRKHQCFM